MARPMRNKVSKVQGRHVMAMFSKNNARKGIRNKSLCISIKYWLLDIIQYDAKQKSAPVTLNSFLLYQNIIYS